MATKGPPWCGHDNALNRSLSWWRFLLGGTTHLQKEVRRGRDADERDLRLEKVLAQWNKLGDRDAHNDSPRRLTLMNPGRGHPAGIIGSDGQTFRLESSPTQWTRQACIFIRPRYPRYLWSHSLFTRACVSTKVYIPAKIGI